MNIDGRFHDREEFEDRTQRKNRMCALPSSLAGEGATRSVTDEGARH
jgi:hypothetical protein